MVLRSIRSPSPTARGTCHAPCATRMLVTCQLLSFLFLILTFSHGSADAQPRCYRSMVQSPSPFLGNHGEVVELADGSLWRILYEYSYLYQYYPSVIVCPGEGVLIVGRHSLSVEALTAGALPETPASPPIPGSASVITSRIDGTFEGFEHGRVFTLQNGQIWRQTSFALRLRLRLAPRVYIVPVAGGFEMSVEDMDGSVRVERLR